jgi:TolB-like protein/Tfp pilus assembly protein PilF
MSFFAELKRRNVFRVGIAYLIGSWLLAQIAELLLDTFNAPEWTMQFIFVVLLIGFPIAIFFAWAFELTPDGVKRESEVDRSQSIRQETGQKLNRGIIIILVLALAYFVWESRFADTGSGPISEQTLEQATSAEENSALTPGDAEPVANRSVAVLPFVNMSSNPEQEYFSDGITEEIINALVKIPGLSVPARTSVFGFKGHQGDVRKIGEQLGVAHVLEGSIRSQGNQVRITAQLIKVDDGFHLWSETYDRKLDNIFVVQEEIASAIATVLTGELGLDVVTVPNKTRNMEAYDSYLQGRALLHKRDNLDQAVALFKRTTELDPQFAPAWAAMALTYTVMDLTPELLEKAISTAKHALSLDPENVDALDALASALRDSWQWAEAEPYFEQAMTIDPQSTELLEDYAEFLGMVGRFDEYLSTAQEGYAIDPLLGPLADAYVMALMANGQYARAIEVIEQWNRLTEQTQIIAWWYEPYWKMLPLMASGDDTGAIAMANRLGPDNMAEPIRTAIIALLENPANEQARDVLRTAISGENITYYDSDAWMANLALIHAGDIDFVIDHIIADSQKFRFGNIEDIWSPIYAKLRHHPRFEEYLEILNLPEYWDQAGWPDICQRHDDGRIACQ